MDKLFKTEIMKSMKKMKQKSKKQKKKIPNIVIFNKKQSLLYHWKGNIIVL